MSFSVYIIMLGGIAAISVLIELVLPDSSTSKYIRSILAIFIVFAIISPLPKIIKNIKIDISSNGSQILDENFLQDLTDQKRKLMEENIEKDLKIKNIDATITLSTILTNGEMKIVYASVFVNSCSLSEHEANLSIKTIIKKYVKLDDNNINILFGSNNEE